MKVGRKDHRKVRLHADEVSTFLIIIISMKIQLALLVTVSARESISQEDYL